MLIGFLPTFEVDTKVIYGYNFLAHLKTIKHRKTIFSDTNFVNRENQSTWNNWNLAICENKSTQKMLVLASTKINPRGN